MNDPEANGIRRLEQSNLPPDAVTLIRVSASNPEYYETALSPYLNVFGPERVGVILAGIAKNFSSVLAANNETVLSAEQIEAAVAKGFNDSMVSGPFVTK